MAASRRKAPGRRWSATSTVELYDGTGVRIATASGAVPAKAVVRYRLDGRNKKYTLRGDNLAQVRSTQALLTLAYEQNWLADRRGRPVAPTALPGVGVPPTSGGPSADAGTGPIVGPDVAQVLVLPVNEQPGPAASSSAASLPAVGAPLPIADVSTLVCSHPLR